MNNGGDSEFTTMRPVRGLAEENTPIINSPFAEPRRHWHIHPYEPAKQIDGRRPATYYYLPPGASQPRENSPGYRVELHKVSNIREQLGKWRELALRGEGGVSRVTMDLLNHWRREGRKQPLFFAQLEAAETIIFLTEARDDFLHGINIPDDEPGESKKKEGFAAFRRRCCRMATGAGKTTVMAMLAAWSILNKAANPRDKRYSDAVLVVCPNMTIRTRLAELDPRRDEASIYRTRDIVPMQMMNQLRRGRVHIVNWHVFEPHESRNRVDKRGKRIVRRGTVLIGGKNTTARGKRYLTEDTLLRWESMGLLKILKKHPDSPDKGTLKKAEIEEVRHIESDEGVVRRVLHKELGNAQNILVFNDEAHHAYRLQADAKDDDLFDEEESAESYYKEATVWVDGLDKIHKRRGINFCADFSATPYFLGGKAGGNKNRIFPWTVSSFSLEDAIESGIVKIPQLVAQDSTGRDVPGYFNIWKWVTEQLSPSERGGKKSEAKPEAILKYAHAPMEMIGGEWQRAYQSAEDGGDKPVFIIVCKTTKLAKVVFEWLAEGKPPTPNIPRAQLPMLRNSEEKKDNTIRVDHAVQDEIDSGNAKSDDTKWMRHTLDTIGAKEWPKDKRGEPLYPQGFEELAEKLGRKKHPPGRDVRCIVSVGMLTEGWDCNTVTHIIGLRPFMSQLLCEQVVGRGLRRVSYESGEYGMLHEETATVFGVPMTVFPIKGAGAKQKERRPRHHIHALPQRKELEITFPRVEGYVPSGNKDFQFDIGKFAPLAIDPGNIPTQVRMKAGLTDNEGRPSLVAPGGMTKMDMNKFRAAFRFQRRVFELAASLARHYRGNELEMPANILFAKLYAAVDKVLREKMTIAADAHPNDAFLSPYYGLIVERMRACLEITDAEGASELPRLEKSRGEGTTAEVDFWTLRQPYPILKSHINTVVPDSQLEKKAAWKLDNNGKVRAFVKNEGLGFGIPYYRNDEAHDYMPDFIVALENGARLILETKGHDEHKEAKRIAAERWVKAVNASGKYGKWHYRMIGSENEVEDAVNAAV